MRCKPLVLGWLLLFALAAGCKQQVFLTEKIFNDACSQLPAYLENDPYAAASPLTPHVDAPPDVNDPDRPPKYLSLQEAIAISLENGLPSGRTVSNLGLPNVTVDDNMLNFAGGPMNNQTDRVRVIALESAIKAANMEASLARFDANWVTSMNWTATDNLQQGLSSFQNGQRAELASSIVKAFATGGVANISFINQYQLLQSPPVGIFGVQNPLYTSRVQIGFEQPLWRDYGVEINQLLTRFPSITGSTMPPAAAGFFNGRLGGGNFGPVEGILISRLRFDQQRAEFERNIHILVKNVELAYWNLYYAYGRLYSFEEVMRLAHTAWMVGKSRFEAGKDRADQFYPIRAQFEEFRGERMAALGAVLEAERSLRGIMGLPIEDGFRLVPITPPRLAPYQPDWNLALQDTLNLRPELILARDNLKSLQLNLITQKNFLKPDLRFTALYSPVGFGTRLDGNGILVDGTGTTRTNNAWRSLGDADFNDWSIGLTLGMPLGFRLEHAAARAARLQMAQAYYVLEDQEQKATRFLAFTYQKLAEWHRLIQARRAERIAYAEAIKALNDKVNVGQLSPGDLTLLDFRRRFASASVKEYEAIAQYNDFLALFEWAKGTILQYDSVHIAEGPLPDCVHVRAVDNERERTRALVLAERPEPIAHPGRLVHEMPAPMLEDESHIVPASHNETVPGPDAFQRLGTQLFTEPQLPSLPTSQGMQPANPNPVVAPTAATHPGDTNSGQAELSNPPTVQRDNEPRLTPPALPESPLGFLDGIANPLR